MFKNIANWFQTGLWTLLSTFLQNLLFACHRFVCWESVRRFQSHVYRYWKWFYFLFPACPSVLLCWEKILKKLSIFFRHFLRFSRVHKIYYLLIYHRKSVSLPCWRHLWAFGADALKKVTLINIFAFTFKLLTLIMLFTFFTGNSNCTIVRCNLLKICRTKFIGMKTVQIKAFSVKLLFTMCSVESKMQFL